MWKGESRIPVRPKAFAVLSYLVQHAGRLVTQSELLQALWPDTFVQPEVLKSHIREIRTALGDNSKSPLFIETLARRGYRFIKDVTDAAEQKSLPNAGGQPQIIGRERELEKLQDYFKQASSGQAKVVFVTGEAGIGKTTLADAFIRNVTEKLSGLRFARGQCVEGYGVQEPYYPVLVALGKLLRENEELVRLLETHAPTWLAQFPGLLKPEHRQSLQREILGATRQRMVREFCDLLPLVSADDSLVFLLEDIHWADSATIDLISAMAHSRSPAKLLLMATYRPIEVALSQHPLKTVSQDLGVHGLCHELALGPLTEPDVEQYLSRQLPNRSLPSGLAELLHRFSEGNPLFLRAALDHLVARGYLSRAEGKWRLQLPLAEIALEVPEGLRPMIELQIERLSPEERRVLEVASICGVHFLVHVAAQAGEFDLEQYDEICEKLARRGQIVRPAAPRNLPGGAVTPCYQFAHAFYRQTIYERLPSRRRSRLHRGVGRSLQALYSETPARIASELALHFEAGLDWKSAARYLQLVAGNKGQRFAYREAASDLEHALELLAKLPASDDSAGEMEVMQKLGVLYFALEDFSRSILILETVAKRAALAQDSLTEISTLIQMGIVLGRTSVARAAKVVERLFVLCEREQNRSLQARARMGALLLRLTTQGLRERDALEFRIELTKAGPHLDKCTLAAHTAEYALFQLFSSAYQDSIGSMEENLPVLVEAGDIRHRAGLLIFIMGLIFSGNWSKALRVAQEATATAQKNGNHREHVLRLYQAWPHLLAQDWSGGLALCEAALPMMREPYQAVFLRQGLIFAGTAHAALGNYERASKYLAQARQEMEAGQVVMDWYWKMPLQSALTELALQRGDLAQARIEARRFAETSLAYGERTWQALAWEAGARVALADSDLPHAQDCIHKAFALMQEFDLPLACWRVHATAMRIFPEAAEDHQQIAAAEIQRLAESLAEFPALRNTFLSSEPVRGLLLPVQSSHARAASLQTATVMKEGASPCRIPPY